MEKTVSSNIEKLASEPAPPEGGRAMLVSSPILQSYGYDLYPRTVKIRKEYRGPIPTPPDRSLFEINSFSPKSRGRLRFTAANSNNIIKSQFCMTYGDVWPINGRSLKSDLNRFITRVRQVYPGIQYVWIAEFQTRGCPHFHFFSSLQVNDEIHDSLTRIWHKIAGYGQDKHLKVHAHAKNFIPWTMGNGSYLCKYLDKIHQKAIPDGFFSFGRWWGNSRGLIAEPEHIPFTTIDRIPAQVFVDTTTGEISETSTNVWLIRQLGRYHEKGNSRSWFRRSSKSVSALTGAPILRQLLKYIDKQHKITTLPPF